jgi:hypothetical protein
LVPYILDKICKNHKCYHLQNVQNLGFGIEQVDLPDSPSIISQLYSDGVIDMKAVTYSINDDSGSESFIELGSYNESDPGFATASLIGDSLTE